MLTLASVIVALAGIAMLALMPLPRDYRQRLLQQVLGTTLFTAGVAGVVAVVFLGGRIIG